MTQSPNSMSVMDAINGRSSVRAYAPGKLDQATLNKLLAVAVNHRGFQWVN